MDELELELKPVPQPEPYFHREDPQPYRRTRRIPPWLLAAGMMGGLKGEYLFGEDGASKAVETPRPPEQCGLPGCGKPVGRGYQYCCADHCREHRQRQREALS